MTTPINRPAGVPRARSRAGAVAIVAAVAGAVTLLIRLAMHRRSFDLFGDEVIYTDLGRSVISGGFPRFDGGRSSCTGRASSTSKPAGRGSRATSLT